MFVKRIILEKIKNSLFKGKAIILYGARQVGKTTILKKLAEQFEKVLFLNCDEPDIRLNLTNKSSSFLKDFIGNNKIVILDEAQRVENIGLTIKLLVDNFPEIQIIASGSSSFDLSNRIKEPLTGRKYEFFLHPFSIKELLSIYSKTEINRILENRIIFGMYPEVVLTGSLNYLKQLAQDYLYKDILSYTRIRSHEAIVKLLQALALQVGSQVSYSELSGLTGIDIKTVESYIDILEKSFIIFKVMPFSRNIRNELKKGRKIFFWDNGIRNAIINNFNPLSLRNDIGQLWENFIISERLKKQLYSGIFSNNYFWRTYNKKEIDWVEEREGKIFGYEIKFKPKRKKHPPKDWIANYPDAEYKLITKDNFWDFII